MTTSRAAVLVLFMALGLFLSTFIGKGAALLIASGLCLVAAVTLLLDVAHARR